MSNNDCLHVVFTGLCFCDSSAKQIPRPHILRLRSVHWTTLSALLGLQPIEFSSYPWLKMLTVSTANCSILAKCNTPTLSVLTSVHRPHGQLHAQPESFDGSPTNHHPPPSGSCHGHHDQRVAFYLLAAQYHLHYAVRRLWPGACSFVRPYPIRAPSARTAEAALPVCICNRCMHNHCSS